MKILHLNITHEAFSVMVTGEKTKEYRMPTDWIKSRLLGVRKTPHYDRVKFTAGYGRNKPYFICIFKGYEWITVWKDIEFSNGLTITPGDYYEISLGHIVEVGNYQYTVKSSHKNYRAICGILDQMGYATNIMRAGKKAYNLVVNGEIKRVYTNRQNAKNRVIKLLNQNIQYYGCKRTGPPGKRNARCTKKVFPVCKDREREQATATGN